ncbi:MAG: hypothetical protein NVSMB27_05460 [Ktedonobacteraceae bacterium]
MSEILLEHAALLALLDSVQAGAMVSIDPAHLFPANADERRTVLQDGEKLLARDGLLQFNKYGTPILDSHLLTIANTIAYPKIAILLIHNDQVMGLQFFWFYRSTGQIVEHTFSKDRLHRLTELADVTALVNRMEEIFALRGGNTGHSPEETRGKIDQNAFFTVKNLAKNHEHVRAKEILHDFGFAEQSADAFLHVLEQPASADNIALLRCSNETVIDGRNIALLQDEQSTWSARQSVPGVPVLVVETTDASAVKEQVRAYFEELSTV